MRPNIFRISFPIGAIILTGASCSSSTEPTSEAAAPQASEEEIVFDFEKDGEGKLPDDGFTGGPDRWWLPGANGRFRRPAACRPAGRSWRN